MLAYPQIDPVALALGPLKIHWYGLMYLIGIGSAGLPNDGPVGRYVIYDQARQEILLRTL